MQRKFKSFALFSLLHSFFCLPQQLKELLHTKALEDAEERGRRRAEPGLMAEVDSELGVMREELDAMNAEVAVLRTQSQAHMIKYKAELLGRCDAIDAENADFRVNLEGQESRLNCLENAMPDADWQEGALSAGINFNKTTILLASKDIKAMAGRLGKIEEAQKKAVQKVDKCEKDVLELDSTVGDMVGSMGTLFEDTDDLTASLEKLQDMIETQGGRVAVTEPSSPRTAKRKEEERTGAGRVKDTMEGVVKQAAQNKACCDALANQVEVLAAQVTQHNKSILEHATNMADLEGQIEDVVVTCGVISEEVDALGTAAARSRDIESAPKPTELTSGDTGDVPRLRNDSLP